MKNWKKIVIAIVAILVLGGAGLWVHEVRQTDKSSSSSVQQVQSKVINYDGEEGKTAYEILKSKYQVEVSESSLGIMVKSIGGLASSDKEFWLYSVNGQQPDVGADKYVTHAGDKVTWEYKGM